MLIPAKTSSPCSVKKSFWGSTGFYIAYRPDWTWIKLRGAPQFSRWRARWDEMTVFSVACWHYKGHIGKLISSRRWKKPPFRRGWVSSRDSSRAQRGSQIHSWFVFTFEEKTSRISLDMFAGLARLSVFYYGSSSSVPWILICSGWRSAQSPWLTDSHKDKTTRRTVRLLWWIRTNWLPRTVESVIRWRSSVHLCL